MKSLALGLLALILFIAPAHAFKIERVVSAGGIEAWLVEEHAVPLIAVQVGFKAGAAVEPANRQGLATMLAGLLDEGAGELDSLSFRKRLEDKAIRMGFGASRDDFTGSLATLAENRDEAFNLFRLALTAPRFDDEPIVRIRSQLQAVLVRESEDPDDIAAKMWFAEAFGAHPYAHPSNGTIESLEAITREDLKSYLSRFLSRDRMKIAVVGAIDAKTLRPLLDKTFGQLPKAGASVDVPETTVSGTSAIGVVQRDNPQSVVIFGGPGLKRHDPDFFPAYVLNYIFGGGGFASRLTQEVREKRGLVYSVYTYLAPMDRAGLLLGGLATENATVKESIGLVQTEMKRVLKEGVSDDDLKNAKTYLTGSYPLRFSSNAKIADELVGIQLEDLGIDYVEKRNGFIEAVTRDDLKRVAPRFLDPSRLVITVVGKPQGLKPTH